ncbi:MBL fold metallo-hydrolase [Tenuifilum thalassicum]|uniref:MBL fold metallo-hydrolase n=1 Tax=Tenuifilum thalassicum TaxID=2590900 RepID=A0A7D3XWX9_9BACT|nr:MBL fold metallo-hydrolase [Tenuifilum thalassicum]QKG80711.1 MBL fold metallo-hydrolase [Tenuifilum thalassicum]
MKTLLKVMLFIVTGGFAILLGIILFINTERFGKIPSGERLERIKKSPNYKNGSFQNLQPTPMLSDGVGLFDVLFEYFYRSKPKEPTTKLPSKRTDLKSISPKEDVLIWMGHSSYYFQINGIKFLVDPVLSGNASPVTFTTKAYDGADIYTADDIPKIDYLILTHDHWDHMDYRTLKRLKHKVKRIITGLGNGSHLERWGFSSDVIYEGDWFDSLTFNEELKIHVTPARHFSGRGLQRNKTLWASFVIKLPNYSVYVGGDSGYGTHFKEIGEKYGPFDLAVLENGQYDEKWKYIHMLPGEQLKAATDLKAKTVLPVHSSKFTLANHNWNEPLQKIAEKAMKFRYRVITPMIGEMVLLNDINQKFSEWWNF